MPIKVLFIGNSHTYFNYMPRMLSMLVDSEDRGFSLTTAQCTGEGAGLEWHWHNRASRDAIAAENWQYVVLQDRSGGPLEQPAVFKRYAELLDAEIGKQGAQTILFLTWANRRRPETQALLNKIYLETAQRLGALPAPVGRAWAALKAANPDIELHHRDGRHANPTGSYLAACVFYSVLSGISPAGLPGRFRHKGKEWLNLPTSRALLLQQTAWETVNQGVPSPFE